MEINFKSILVGIGLAFLGYVLIRGWQMLTALKADFDEADKTGR